MGCKVEYGYDGRELQVHAFDSHSDAVQYLTAARPYTFVRHQTNSDDAGIAFFQGRDPMAKASLTQSRHGYWLAMFWRVDDARAF